MLLEAVNIKGYYNTSRGYVRAVDGCSLKVKEGEIAGIAGESACGKSTLGKLLIGYDKPPLKMVEGKVIVDGINIYDFPWSKRKSLWGSLVAMIPQYSMNSLNPTIKISDFIVDAMKEKFQSKKVSKDEVLKKAELRFKELGLSAGVLDMYPFELSGGMKQRAVIAISTLLNPRLLVADEPTSALDVSTQKLLLELLLYVVKSRIVGSLIVISHDIASLRQICDQTYIMYAGKIVESSPTDEIIDCPFHPYTKLLLNAVITIQPEIREQRLKSISGTPPQLVKPPQGCRFFERCPDAMGKCKDEEPPSIEVKPGRFVACWLYG